MVRSARLTDVRVLNKSILLSVSPFSILSQSSSFQSFLTFNQPANSIHKRRPMQLDIQSHRKFGRSISLL